MTVFMRVAYVVLLAMAFAHSALASPAELELISGATTVLVTDNGSGDSNSSIGAINYNGTVGLWTVTVAAGVSTSPAVTTLPLQLTTSASSSGASILEILFSDTGFNTASPNFSTTYSAGAFAGAGTATQKAYLDASNTVFNETTLIGTVGPFNSFSAGSAVGVGIASVPYSLTLEQVLSASSAASFLAGGAIEPAPEIPTLLLFGTGLLAIGGLARGKRVSF